MGDFQNFNKIEIQKSPGKTQQSIKIENCPGETIFSAQDDIFAWDNFYPRQKFAWGKKPKNGYLPKTKKPRLIADLPLDHTDG